MCLTDVFPAVLASALALWVGAECACRRWAGTRPAGSPPGSRSHSGSGTRTWDVGTSLREPAGEEEQETAGTNWKKKKARGRLKCDPTIQQN